jgi:hypothetical protein
MSAITVAGRRSAVQSWRPGTWPCPTAGQIQPHQAGFEIAHVQAARCGQPGQGCASDRPAPNPRWRAAARARSSGGGPLRPPSAAREGNSPMGHRPPPGQRVQGGAQPWLGAKAAADHRDLAVVPLVDDLAELQPERDPCRLSCSCLRLSSPPIVCATAIGPPHQDFRPDYPRPRPIRFGAGQARSEHTGIPRLAPGQVLPGVRCSHAGRGRCTLPACGLWRGRRPGSNAWPRRCIASPP